MNVPSLKPPYRPRQPSGAWREEAQAFKPWPKRAWAWITVSHRVLTTCAAMCAATITIHGYLKALEVKTIVKAAVEEVVERTNNTRDARLKILEMQVAGVPEWRGATTTLDGIQDNRLRTLENETENFKKQLLIVAMRRGQL